MPTAQGADWGFRSLVLSLGLVVGWEGKDQEKVRKGVE